MIKRLISAILEFLRWIDGSEKEIMQLERKIEWLEEQLEQKTIYAQYQEGSAVYLEKQLNVVRNERSELIRKTKKLSHENYELNQWNKELERRLEEMQPKTQPEEPADVGEDWLPDDTPIEMLGLNVQVNLILQGAGIETVGELCGWKMSDLLACGDFGEARANQVFMALAKHGRRLMPEDDPKQKQRVERVLMPSREKLMTLEELGLTIRTYNLVGKTGFRSAYEICQQYKPELIRKIDDESAYRELIERIKDLGFKMRRGFYP